MTTGSFNRPPRDFYGLEGALVDLAVRGWVSSLPGDSTWFERVGIAVRANDRWVAHSDWLDSVLPAPSARALAVRSLLRDPTYRLHIDRVLASVCRAIGSSERWKRLDELLAGPLRGNAPRIASLLRQPDTWEPDRSWESVDTYCWGRAGSSDVLFPLLVASAATWHATPIYVNEPSRDPARLVAGTDAGEAIRLGVEEAQRLSAEVNNTAPVWLHPLRDGSIEVTLAVPVHAEWAGKALDVAGYPFSLGVPTEARM